MQNLRSFPGKLSMKYGLVHDDITLANHLAVAKRTSDLIYQKDYKEVTTFLLMFYTEVFNVGKQVYIH